VPEYRDRYESYPLWSLLTIVLLAVLCEAPRGQKDLAKFARGFSQPQRRALGIRRSPRGKYPAPHPSTFCRFFQNVDGRKDELVSLLTSAEPEKLPAQKWLQLNRFGWGIESGTPQRLDVSHHDDRCRRVFASARTFQAHWPRSHATKNPCGGGACPLVLAHGTLHAFALKRHKLCRGIMFR